MLDVGVPGRAGRGGDREHPERQAPERLQPAQQEDEDQSEEESVDELDRLDPGGTLEEVPQQHLLDRHGVDRHTGRGQVEGRGAQILEARGRGADGDRLAGERAIGDGTGQHPPGGDGTPRLGPGEVQPHASCFIGRNHEAAHRHFRDGRQRSLDAGLLHPDLVAVGPEQDSEHLSGEARADLFPDPEYQRNAAQHSVDGREEVEATDSVRAGIDARQIDDRTGESRQHRQRTGPCDLDGIGARGAASCSACGSGRTP